MGWEAGGHLDFATLALKGLSFSSGSYAISTLTQLLLLHTESWQPLVG